MLRRTKLIIVALIAIGYGIVPIVSLVDSLLFFDGFQYTTPYLFQNLYEATLFFGGVGAGIYIMRKDEKLRNKK